MAISNNKKVLSIIDVLLMTVTANFGIRWIAVAAGIGPSSLFLWLFGAVLFFMPLAIITAQMARAHPDEGGLYAWTRLTLGEKHGFTVAWLYWINNIFYYPAILIFLASNFAYLIGRPDLTENTTFVLTTALVGFWIIVAISLFGLKTSKYVVSFAGIFGLIIPLLLLVFFAVLAYVKLGGSATDFSWNNFIPGGKIMGNLSSLSMIMFAMAGVEVTATFANRVERPKRDLYGGLLLGSAGIFILYVTGTLSMNILAAPAELLKTSGLMQTFAIIDQKFNISWLSRIIAGCVTFAELAAIVVWLLAPVIMFFKCTPRGIVPEWMHKTDKNDTPINAILFQGILVSIIIAVTSLLPNVNAMYQVLVLMATVLYFIPYLFLAVAYIRSIAVIGMNKFVAYSLAIGVFASITLGIIVSFVPSEDLKTAHDIWLYESELILGPILIIAIGWLLYRFRKVA